MIICLIEDDPAVRASTRELMEAFGFKVQAYVSAQTFLADEFMEEHCDCIVSDIRMPGMGGFELLAELRRRGRDIPVIFVTGHGDVAMAVQAINDGAVDFLEKPVDSDALLAGLLRAMVKSHERAEKTAEVRHARERVVSLTPRERSVLDQLVLGHANKVVAVKLGISPRTVEIHRANIMRKFDAENLADIARIYIIAEPSLALKLAHAS